ncbi:abortive infection system antitoxin AbiGi family protein [Paucibacter soli]|uniref:abortive infection system antitoxin AbiGi family protein n=1 Tax=Paucibacter soli TaxID=3133433 RepID=UPI00309B9672
MRPKSQSLFHFTKDLTTLQKILTGGFWPRYSVEDYNWQALGPGSIDFAAIPMVCFCDIPLSRIDEHVAFYGYYGIGLSREWAESNGLNPLLYIAAENSLARSLIGLADVARKAPGDDALIGGALIQHAASFMKQTSGKTTRSGTEIEKDFYQESEWRFVPFHAEIPQILTREKFEDTAFLEQCNSKTQALATLKFSLSDVRYVFVREDSEIPSMINFIQNAMDHHPGAATKVLMSRVTSLETLRGDW